MGRTSSSNWSADQSNLVGSASAGISYPGLQQDFCTLWHELVEEARYQRPYSIPSQILRAIRHHYIALHQGTDAAPTTFSSFFAMMEPSSYPLCDIASHRPNSTAVPAPNSRVVSLLTQPQCFTQCLPSPLCLWRHHRFTTSQRSWHHRGSPFAI
jgi:hypothetical protein